MPDASGGFVVYTVVKMRIHRRFEDMPMRIVVADEQPKVRFALRVLLGSKDGCEVVGEIESADDLLALAEESYPDLILLGWELPGLNAVGTLGALREICPSATVIALSGWPEARKDALAAGADIFVSKADPPERLLNAIDSCTCV
jgi:DNA-binding NarL/FixJ family response regulator